VAGGFKGAAPPASSTVGADHATPTDAQSKGGEVDTAAGVDLSFVIQVLLNFM
jgi:hypothetical protein